MPDPAFSDRDTLDATACVNLLSALRPVVETVSALDAARYCNRSKRTIHRAIHQGLCPSATRDTIGDWRIPRADLDAFKATVQSIVRGRPVIYPRVEAAPAPLVTIDLDDERLRINAEYRARRAVLDAELAEVEAALSLEASPLPVEGAPFSA